MKRRIFIAINLPQDIKKKLSSYQSFWPELPVRWTKTDNLHITLEFLGYVSDEEILDILQKAKEFALKHSSFFVHLNKICYGPPNKMPCSEMQSLTGRLDKVENRPPRMIWVEGEKSKELASLKADVQKVLIGSNVKFEQEDRVFSPHITLGRIKTFQWNQIEPEERPEVNQDINLEFEVTSIEVMENRLKRAGPDYEILESYPLNDL